MKQVSRRMVCMVLLGVLFTTSMSQTGKAAEFEAVGENVSDSAATSVCAAYATKCDAKLSLSSGKAEIYAKISGYISVSKIHAKVVLQRYTSGSWRTVKTYEDTVSASSYSMSKSKAVSKGKYRVKAVFTLYKGAKSEKVIKYSSTVTYAS